ncbi:M43 family zinc metalloprotease [Polluticoccus soli]|uniref:M43 family zinc metalloprotease n=1 Tax=Polluticoccus soli TaxID=3034150 RepID=UPI0023E0DB47|nr:M43 family zinc metalloprotease [Flavipsychrobacter sp. JY13-12]
MVKKAILLLSALAGLNGAANAQKCATDEYQRDLIKLNPKVAEVQQALEMYLKGANLKTTASSYKAFQDSIYAAETATRLYVPVVVHVIHDYGTEYVSDNEIFTMIKELNQVYNAQNDLSAVIAPFKQYIGKANIEFRLAQKDPLGNRTNGITRRQSYLRLGGDDQAKFDQWSPERYLNIWLINVIGRGVAGGTVLAYATLPSGAASFPYNDGVISRADRITNDMTIPHEVGHYLNLLHVWNSSQVDVGQACGDDEVDDTPPTKGHFSTCPLNDTECASNYYKVYPYAANGGPVVNDTIDYPDTANVQNIMDYSNCTNMFSKLQVMRMRTTLKSPVAKRDQLVTPLTHSATGIFDPQDIPPVAEFSVEKLTVPFAAERTYYMCEDQPATSTFVFKNRSWRDTVTSVNWEFSNGGGSVSQNANQLSNNVSVVFTEPGWATVKLTATSNAGATTVETKSVYVANRDYTVPAGYYQEFNQNEYDQWPSFNYYNNATKWEVDNNAGFHDKTCMVYRGYDPRTSPQWYVGMHKGDYDDFFTPAYDLSGMTSGDCNINFMTSGAFRTSFSDFMKDTLELAYSTDCGATWRKFDRLTKADLANKGTYSGKYAPLWQGDWALQSRNIPAAARTSKTFFRFRYIPSVDETANTNVFIGTSNNFYLDRINVSNFPLGLNTVMSDNKNVAVAPNPTNGNSFVVVQANGSDNATVQVTDLTGRVVYRVQQQMSAGANRIEIPATAIAVKGVYMVQVVTGGQTHTEKLVSY